MSIAEVMDLTPVIDILETDDGTSSLTITRRAAGTYVNGLYVAGSTSSLIVQANVQPPTTKDVMMMPEGLRTKDMLAVYSKVALQPPVEKGAQGDQFTHGGELFEVMKIRDWLETAGYFKSISVKVELT